MALQAIGQQLRALREKSASLVAEALRDIENAFANTYRDMGWFSISDKASGIRKDIIESPLFRVLGGNQSTRAARIFSENNATIIQLVESRSLVIKDALQNIDVVISSGDVSIYSGGSPVLRLVGINGYIDPSTGDFLGNLSVNGGTYPDYIATRFIDSTKNYSDDVATFVDGPSGNSEIHQRVDVGDATLEIKKGTDNRVTAVVDATAVVLTVGNASADTVIKPESVATDRLGVGVSAPSTNGHAHVGTFLGAAATSASSGEKLRVGGNARVDSNLGIGMNPSRALDVTGDAKITGTLEVDSNAQFDGTVTITGIAAGGQIVAQSAGAITTMDAATGRFYLDVYTKAEVDAAIAAAIAAIVVDAVGNHDHGGMVPADGGHSHSLS